MQILLIFSLLVAVIAVLFAVQNAGVVPVQFLLWKYESPLALSLLLAVLLGALISLLFSLPSITRSKMTIRNQRKRMTELETSLNSANAKLVEAQQKTSDLEKALAGANKPEPVEMPAPAPDVIFNSDAIKPQDS